MESKKIVIGTRSSQLAVSQTQGVADRLGAALPGYEIELKKITTKGDRILDRSLAEIGGKGLFIKELEVALLEGDIDLAIHSMKDMPAELPDDLAITAIPQRVDYRDALISAEGLNIDQLAAGARIGTGSLRRTAQLLKYRPDLEIVPIRGNIDTRLKKLKDDQELNLDAIVLAVAGLLRMGWEDRITQYLSAEIMLPAAGQGALAIETRKEDNRINEIVKIIDDQDTKYALAAERSFLEYLEGDCQVPIGALAEVNGDQISLKGVVSTLDGEKYLSGEKNGSINQAAELGIELAQDLIAEGAEEILKRVRQETDK